MARLARILAGFLAITAACAGQETKATPADSGPVEVYASHPRLFLRPARLRLLQRQRDRQADRWQQFDLLVRADESMPEPGFAYALHYRVSGDERSGRKAVAWALGPGEDLRQLALVFDWCQDLLTADQVTALTKKLAAGLIASENQWSLAWVRSRALASIALYSHIPDLPERTLYRIARVWWQQEAAPAIRGGKPPFSREDGLELMEMLHAFRDAANLDLRQFCPSYFRTLPIERLMSYYPPAYEGPENAVRVAADPELRPPDWRRAAAWRAGDLALAAYDITGTEAQALQGWLMHDRYIMRGAFGAPYEFLWANPYQPGLGYFNLPLSYYNPQTGTLFLRSAWQDSASWIGLFDGNVMRFEAGRATRGARPGEEIRLGSVTVFFPPQGVSFHMRASGPVYLAGLSPGRSYHVEIEGAKAREVFSDPGGLIPLELPRTGDVSVRIR